MAAEVIAVCNQKGGSGKSTIAMHLAAALHELGHQVLVVDADPQNTLVRWSSSATERPLPLRVISLAAAGNKIHREIAKYVPDHEYIIIDCPPGLNTSGDTELATVVLGIAGVALIPLSPSPADMWATRGMLGLVELAEAFNPDLKTFLLLTRVTEGTVLQREAKKLLAEFNRPVLKTWIADRECFKQVMGLGTTVLDAATLTRLRIRGAAPAAKQIRELTQEVIDILQEERPWGRREEKHHP
jgi:chromosome partitioning protein